MSKQIYVVDDDGVAQLIETGIENHSELTDAPILTAYNGVKTVNSYVTVDSGTMTITANQGGVIHGWTETEVINFCQYATAGRYDIFTASEGQEILIIDTSNTSLGRRYRRMNVDCDKIWDDDSSQWITITDTNAKQLIYKVVQDVPDTVVVGDPVVMKIYYYSNIGSGRVTYTVDDTTTYTVGTFSSGTTFDINFTNRITDGEHRFSVKITNSQTSMTLEERKITGINLSYTPNFDQYQAFTNDITFSYSCSGSSTKKVHFDVTDANGGTHSTETTHESGYWSSSVNLPSSFFAKGENTISTYMYAVDSTGTEITRTITTTYRVPFLTDNEPLLMVYYDEWDDLKQYASISIPYYVWRSTSGYLDSVDFMISSAALVGAITYHHDSEESGAIVNYLQYNSAHNWIISSLPTTFKDGEDKKAMFTMQGNYDDTTTNVYQKSNVSIASSSSAMETVEGFLFNFAAKSLTSPISQWTSTGSSPKTMTLSGFNWNTDGIEIDTDGNQSLHFGPGASAILDEATNPLFGAYNVAYTLELDFKVSESAIEEPIIKYYDPDAANPNLYGLFVYPNKSVFKYTGGESEINYMKGERTSIVYTICNKTATDTDPSTGQQKTANLLYLFVYINGILSQMKAIDNSTVFPNQCGTIKFNTNNNDFRLYSFRGYKSSLTSAQVLQNYISNFGNASTKETMYLKNNVYSDTTSSGVQGEYEVSFDKVKGKIPCYIVISDKLPDTKDYVDCRGIYYEMDGTQTFVQLSYLKDGVRYGAEGLPMATTYYYTRATADSPWIRSKKVKFCGQGTSSLAYPRKNFKFKHNDKFYIKGHTSGMEKNFTFKADYMDSSGANNIGNAQVLDDSIIRNKWIGTPVYDNPNLRVNLDGFPIAMFWCKSTEGKGGVVQDPTATNVFDNNGTTPLYDSVKANAEHTLVGEVTPLNPVYIGTYNFNYDKKAKSLLGWDEDTFQGFEFRGNSSNCDLYQGFENMCAMCSTSEGFEWRWTHISDWIDDYHDGHLSLTIDGGYFDEDVEQKYSEAQHLASPKDIVYLKPFNQFYVMKDGIKCQLFKATTTEGVTTYSPINYGTPQYITGEVTNNNLAWDITSCEGISKLSNGICLEFGIKTATKDGVDSLVFQLPYGVTSATPLGTAYPDGTHYYNFTYNPEHEFKYEYNTAETYFTDINNWTVIAPLSEVKARKLVYTQDDAGLYYYDHTSTGVNDGLYHLISNYPAAKQTAILADTTNRYNLTETYESVTTSDTVYTYDFMREIFKNWCYVNEAVAHATTDNWKAIFDSRSTWGDNGNGLFVYDSLTNYYGSSLFTGLCDNFAKNVFMHSYDGGLTWSPAWYDMDTCFGLNNEGAYTKLYDIDFMDVDTTGARAFNGSNSRIWTLLYNNAMSDLKSMYKDLRSGNYISYNKIMNTIYGSNITYKAESLYNANAVYRYMEPLAWHSNTKPEAAQGNRLQLLKYWNSNRQTFLDSRYEGTGWTTDIITLRLNNTETSTFSLVPDTNMFLGASFNSGEATVPSVKSSTKITAGSTWTFTHDPSTNLNTYIYGASHLLEVGDLSLCNSTEYSIATATNLRTLKIGDETHPPIVTTRLNLSSGTAYSNLSSIDLTNVNLVNTSLNFVMTLNNANLMPALQTLKLKGSNVEYLSLAEYTPLEYLSLSDTIRVINLNNLLNLSDLYIYGHSQLESITVSNCPSVDQLSILNTLKNSTIAISMDNLNGTDETRVNLAFMDWLKDCNATLTGGTIYVEALANEDLDVYRTKWPSLNIQWHQIIATEVIFGTTGEGGYHE